MSWLIPPYRWTYDAQALELMRAIAMDADCLRGKCEADHDLGYDLMKRFVPVLVERLQATRLQMLDVYGTPGLTMLHRGDADRPTRWCRASRACAGAGATGRTC